MKIYIKPSNFCKIISVSLHNFYDTSEIGHGQCSYLRVVVMEKAKLARNLSIYPQATICYCCTLSGKIKHEQEKLQVQEFEEKL